MKAYIRFGFVLIITILAQPTLKAQADSTNQSGPVKVIVEEGAQSSETAEVNRPENVSLDTLSGKILSRKEGYRVFVLGGEKPYELRLRNTKTNAIDLKFMLHQADTLLSNGFVDSLPGIAYEVFITDRKNEKAILSELLGEEIPDPPIDPDVTNYTTLIIISVVAIGLLVFFLFFNKKRKPKTMFEE